MAMLGELAGPLWLEWAVESRYAWSLTNFLLFAFLTTFSFPEPGTATAHSFFVFMNATHEARTRSMKSTFNLSNNPHWTRP